MRFVKDNPGAEGLPLAVATPYGLELPPYFKLVSALGTRILDFSAVSRCKQLCFEKIVGCRLVAENRHNQLPQPTPFWLN